MSTTVNRRTLLRRALALAPAAGLRAAPARRSPNFVVIVADDLGWADAGFHGSRYRTPHLDRLARTGVEMHQHYVAPLCTPTRAALLTGRYWSRFGNTSPHNEQVLPFGTITLASALKSRGYETAITGKWHLGSLPEWGPRRFGFDRSYGSLAGGTGPWDHRYKRGPYTRTWHRNDELIEEQGHVTDLIAREAVGFLQAKRQAPFFLYVPFTAVHHPVDEPQEWLAANQDIQENLRQYAACVQHMDDAIGRILTALDKSGQRDNTLVVFFSDNGGMGVEAGSDLKLYPGEYPAGAMLGMNQPLRGRKGQLYEGGIRVTALANWPGRLRPGKALAPVHVIDWMPTLAGLAGYRPERDLKWDGQDVWPLLSAATPQPAPRVLYWKGPGGRSHALRSGVWKLLIHEASGKEKRRVELFHLGDDPYERADRAAGQRPRVEELEKLLLEHMRRDNDAVAPKG